MNKDTVIKIENLGKQYRLGAVGTGTISNDFKRWWYHLRGKEDPFLKIGEKNDRATKGKSDYVWSLKDVNFEIKSGEAIGIIGKNGAGKSTLLKILSRVTSPTTGSVKLKGRVTSLLEVGTGFHPELSGKENIYLNGAILGMSKAEIKSKFDEIVAFSGVERYIDTPVKRYSSGMYVRLAFAVAAHLEPEILIIDEVLAVGDAEFQKKCLGKIKDVTGEGRTVLFVSHNMTAINSLCTRCIYLKDGTVDSIGDTHAIVDRYLGSEHSNKTIFKTEREHAPGDEVAILLAARLIDEGHNKIEFTTLDKGVGIEFTYEVMKEGFCPVPNIHLYTSKGECAFISCENIQAKLSAVGVHKTVMWIPKDLLNEGTYVAGLALSTLSPIKIHFNVREALIFHVIEDLTKREGDFNQRIPGVLKPKLNWETIQIK